MARRQAPAVPQAVARPDPASVLALVRDVIDRSFDFTWPVTAACLARGEVPRLLRRGRLLYLNERRQHRVHLDLRAVDTVLLEHAALFSAGKPAEPMPDGGMTLTEFAAWAGVDRRRAARSVVEIAPGERPRLPPGTVPARRVGDTRRIFRADFLGDPTQLGATHALHHQEAPAGPDPGRIHRQVADLRRRYAPQR